MGLLHLFLTSVSGVAYLDRVIDGKRMKLVKYQLTWDSTGDSTTGGELINVNVFNAGILGSVINSNRIVNKSFLPLCNDITSRQTINTLDLLLATRNKIQDSFEYQITDKDGNAPANLTSIQLFFEYF